MRAPCLWRDLQLSQQRVELRSIPVRVLTNPDFPKHPDGCSHGDLHISPIAASLCRTIELCPETRFQPPRKGMNKMRGKKVDPSSQGLRGKDKGVSGGWSRVRGDCLVVCAYKIVQQPSAGRPMRSPSWLGSWAQRGSWSLR